MIKITSHTVHKNETLPPLLSKLENLKEKILFVVDEKNKLLGSITDGDIRRALSKSKFDARAFEICNISPTYKLETGEITNIKKNVLKIIPVLNERKQIIELEKVDFASSLITSMVIMAGGEGRRLGALTKNLPKPMVLIKEKPMLQHVIENATTQGVKNFIICVNYMKESIKEYFKDGNDFGINISYIEEQKKLDTAGALSLISPEKLPKHFFVKNCDVFEKVSYYDFSLSHLTSNRDATTLAITHHHTIPFGVLQTSGAELLDITEKPIFTNLVNGGVYIFKRDCLIELDHNIPISMPDFLMVLANNGKKVGVYINDGYWLDAGTPDQLKEL